MMGTERDTVRIFNEMASDYDELRDLWYAWLCSRLHYLIARYVIPRKPAMVLDVGCGTGFQAFLHATAGARVVGFDVAREIVRVAQCKALRFRPEESLLLFTPYHKFVERYNEMISNYLNAGALSTRYSAPSFLAANACQIPLSNGLFDHVNCCGSTLSLIGDYSAALHEISRVLKFRGTLFLEVESRWNFDTMWVLLDAFTGGSLGYDTSLREAWRTVLTPPQEHVVIDYPFGEEEDPIYLKLRLFTYRKLKTELRKYGFKPLRRWTIHSVTNLIPSTFLDSMKPQASLRALFAILSAIEDKLPARLPGCSIVLLAEKVAPES